MSVRFIQGLLAIKSVLLGILIAAMWVRSHHTGDALRWGNKTQHIELGSADGSVIIRYANDGRAPADMRLWEIWHADPPQIMLLRARLGESRLNQAGFGLTKEPGDAGRGVVVNVMIPHFLLVLLAIPGPMIWVWHWYHRRRRRIKLGTMSWCPTCWREVEGIVYTCPECGGPLATHDEHEEIIRKTSAR